MSATQHKICCDDDDHFEYEYFADFNEWLDSDEQQEIRIERGVNGLGLYSKAK